MTDQTAAAPVGEKPKRKAPPPLSKAEKAARIAEKRAAILAFLSSESFSVAEIIEQVVGVSRPVVLKTLAAMMRDGLLNDEVFDFGFKKVTVWGITDHGIAATGNFDCVAHVRGKISATRIAHRIDNQRMRVKAEAAGWTEWQSERLLLRLSTIDANNGNKWRKVPDAIGVNPVGQRVAVEIERNSKSPTRYMPIIVAYLQEIKAGRYREVHFVCPPGVEKYVQNAMAQVKYVEIMNEKVELQDSHRARFKFFSYDNWPEVKHG